jgi:hypothetical protein
MGWRTEDSFDEEEGGSYNRFLTFGPGVTEKVCEDLMKTLDEEGME